MKERCAEWTAFVLKTAKGRWDEWPGDGSDEGFDLAGGKVTGVCHSIQSYDGILWAPHFAPPTIVIKSLLTYKGH